MKHKIIWIGILIGFLLGNTIFLIHILGLGESASLIQYLPYIVFYGVFGLIMGSYIDFIIKRRKKSFKSWVFWIVTIYLIIGFFFYFIISLSGYQANAEQYDLFVKCLNNEAITEQDIYTCGLFKEWNVDMESKVKMGKIPYVLSVSGFLNFPSIITWPIRFLVPT